VFCLLDFALRQSATHRPQILWYKDKTEADLGDLNNIVRVLVSMLLIPDFVPLCFAGLARKSTT
jgi:hypothetical protein